MRVLILGAGGFLGTRLAARVQADGHVGGRAVDELVLFDMRPFDQGVRQPAAAPCTVRQMHGDLRDARVLDELFSLPLDVVFHLAATLTLDAESDFRRGLETNVLALIGLLERSRAQASAPMFLFASSISTFGGALPPVVGDDVVQAPTTSYGTHKVVAELLLADHSRHGFVDGRSLRLPIVVTHPGPPSGSISDQVSALIREPMHGQNLVCRMAPDGPMALASVSTVIDGFLRLASVPEDAIRLARAMNLPGLTVTPADLVQAVVRRRGAAAGALVAWEPDPGVQRIIDGWPKAFTSERALALGIRPDASVDALVEDFVASEKSAT